MTPTSWLTTCQRQQEDGRWVPAVPLPGPFLWRLKDAWAVLWGRAEAVYEG